jgi:4'-phosphopantetheinyl transferase
MGKRNRKTWPWKAWGERGRLEPGEIHIHLLRTGSGNFQVPVKDLLSFLPAEERRRYAQFGLEDRRREFLWSRLLVRCVLASFLNRDMRDINFGYRDNGKPFLENSEIQFNLSHTEGLIACSVARRRLGIDVEKVTRGEEVERRWNLLARRYFSTAEKEFLLSQDRASRSTAFFRIFTMKEARVKASGEGLSLPLEDFSVPLTPMEKSVSGCWEYLTKLLGPGDICLAHTVENPGRMPLGYRVWEWEAHFFENFLISHSSTSIK